MVSPKRDSRRRRDILETSTMSEAKTPPEAENLRDKHWVGGEIPAGGGDSLETRTRSEVKFLAEAGNFHRQALDPKGGSSRIYPLVSEKCLNLKSSLSCHSTGKPSKPNGKPWQNQCKTIENHYTE